MFGGDADLLELRHRLSRDPDFIPEPPRRAPKRSAARPRLLVQTLVLVASTAFVAFAVVELLRARDQIMSSGIGFAVLKSPAVPANKGSRPAAPVLLGIHDRQALMDEPLALGAVLFGAGEEAMHVSGLSEGSRLSAGEPWGSDGWRVRAQEVAGILVLPPAAFVGTMYAVIELHAPGRSAPVDRQLARLEWIAKPRSALAPLPVDRGDIAQRALSGVSSIRKRHLLGWSARRDRRRGLYYVEADRRFPEAQMGCGIQVPAGRVWPEVRGLLSAVGARREGLS
jgi:hypothetical protein